jgi:hypothetical protein
MAKFGGGLFRTRNILGGALLAGIGFGIYLGQFKGFGLGGNGWGGFGTNSVQVDSKHDESEKSGRSEDKIRNASNIVETDSEEDAADLPDVGKVVRVLIDDRQFMLRGSGGAADVPISLNKLVQLVKKSPGDDDGFRVRIYQRPNARASAEEGLKEALSAAGIEDTAIFWVPTALR